MISLSPRKIGVLKICQEMPAARHPVHHEKDVQDDLHEETGGVWADEIRGK